MQIKFVTRSGTNNFSGSGYDYYRSDKLNANTWFNNRDGVGKPKLLQNQPGVRVGGPIVIPGLFDGHNKAFFFVNYEEFRQPSDTTRQPHDPQPGRAGRQLQLPRGGVTVNVLALAAANGQLATRRSDDRQVLSRHPHARPATTGRSRHRRQPAALHVQRRRSQSMRRYPTVALDYNLTNKHRLQRSLQLPEVHRLRPTR